MKKLTFLLTSFMLLSCWKNNKEGEQFYAEDNSPIDTTLEYRDWETDRKSTRLNSSHSGESRMPSSA